MIKYTHIATLTQSLKAHGHNRSFISALHVDHVGGFIKIINVEVCRSLSHKLVTLSVNAHKQTNNIKHMFYSVH